MKVRKVYFFGSSTSSNYLQKPSSFKTGCTAGKRISKVISVRSVANLIILFSKPKRVTDSPCNLIH